VGALNNFGDCKHPYALTQVELVDTIKWFQRAGVLMVVVAISMQLLWILLLPYLSMVVFAKEF
jgi:hypothetical protein